jgi:hypothetical protein
VQDRYRALVARLFAETGVDLPRRLRHRRHADLAPWGWRVWINGLLRATGTLPGPGSAGTAASADAHQDRLWVHPLTGRTHSWGEQKVAGGAALTVGDVVIAHLEAALREALAEFADIEWVRVVLTRLERDGHLVLVEALRERYTVERLSLLLGELVTTGLSARDPTAFDPLLAGEEVATAGANGDRRRQPNLTTVSLPAEHQAALRDAAVTRMPTAELYRSPPAAALISWLEANHDTSGGDVVRLAVPRDLHRSVARLVRAQFPNLAVVGSD